MQKKYILDTNVLLNDPNCIDVLYNGAENQIFIPRHVILELDNLKKDNKKRHLVNKAIDSLIENKDKITMLETKNLCPTFDHRVDDYIIKDIFDHKLNEDGILVTNDKILQFDCTNINIQCEEYKSSNPFKSESEKYTGFANPEHEFIHNSFFWEEGKLLFNDGMSNPKLINFEYDIWKVKPKTVYQNAAFALMTSDHIDICSIQSSAGLGKTFIALATAFFLVFQKKKYSKIYITKPNIEIGQPLGFLPGDVKEKLAPYVSYLDDLILKLHKMRPVNKLYENEDSKIYNQDIFKILPINFIRGMNLEDAVVIVDECQNLTRMETRTLLSRFGENVKCICLGDTSQVDHPYLNADNNGLNWIVKLFKNNKNYGHITLLGNKTRGPICDLVLKTGL